MDKIDVKNIQQQVKQLQQQYKLTQEQLSLMRVILQDEGQKQVNQTVSDTIKAKQDPLYQTMIDLIVSQPALKFASYSVIEITKVNNKWVFRTNIGNDYIDITEIQTLQNIGKYYLMDNFKCPYVYDRTETIVLDCSYLHQCYAKDLMRLTKQGQYVQFKNLTDITLLQGDMKYTEQLQIYLYNQGETINYVNVNLDDIPFSSADITGKYKTKVVLYINSLRKIGETQWLINSDYIYINRFTFQSTQFEQNLTTSHIQQIYTDTDKKIYFKEILDRPVTFQQILNMDRRIIGSPDTVLANSYISGWN